ncbi:unnamed protein product [Phytophthora fragariaefolia]|uniref:Unnamed protein product n=1 Tax=Phytophthora fragariaefolia TaxID=1490495 RepID=A0A9W6XM87_9STRA|nr:unnamed protein product [Phytophthora fragariaefolia]
MVIMAYSSPREVRSLLKIAAFGILVVHTIRAETRGNGSTSESVAEELPGCGISDGDKAFGIQAIADRRCAAGGLGCYNDHCRYCKVLDTLKSAHLDSCESLGVAFPSMAPLAVSTSPCNVSSGDTAVGVAGMDDISCLYGGLGCFNDHCRFCQTKLTQQSSQFLLCSWMYDSTSRSGDEGDLNFVTANIGEHTVESVQTTISSSSLNEDEEAFETGYMSSCNLTATDGDLAVGITITTDASCASGGIGCIDSICRFCRSQNTTQSAHLDVCPVATKVCTTTVSAGDAAVGINIISDASCAVGGLGCIDDVCRFCKVRITQQSATFQSCSDFVTTLAPTCNQVASDGDAAVGIKIVTDTTCTNGGLGCIDTVCRFCRVTTTAQSASYVDCALINPSTSVTLAPTHTTLALTTAPATTVPALTSTKQTCSRTVSEGDSAVGINIVTDSSCAYGGLGCIDQVCRFCRVTTSVQSAAFIDCATIKGATSAAQTTAPAPTAVGSTTSPPTTAPPTAAPTPVPSTTSSPTAAPTQTPAPTTLAPSQATAITTPTPTTYATPSIVFECTRTVSRGDKGVGLDIVSDIRCSEGGTGCLDDVCRFCKRFDTMQSQAYIDCSSIPSANIGADIKFVPIPNVSDSESPTRLLLLADSTDTTSSLTSFNSLTELTSSRNLFERLESATTNACATTVSVGDAAVGINIVTDTSCINGGTGCIDNVCRYCKTQDTIQSAHLNGCPTSTTTTTPSSLSTPAPTIPTSTIVSKVCSTTLSDGDTEAGIGVITDTTCANGGLGCVDSVCRLCKTKTTGQSAHLGSCSEYLSSSSSTTTATSAPTPAPSPVVTTTTPTTAPESTTSAYSIPLDCYQTVSSGDKSVGLDIVTDIRCGDGGVGCVDSICRYCKRFETTQSHSYLSCSDIPSSENGADITFKVIAEVDDSQEATQFDEIVPDQESADFSSETKEACANVLLADGQMEGGIGVVLDTLHCPEGLTSGCIGDAGCRYCMRFPTNISDYLEYCEIVNASDVAYTLSGEGIISADESSSQLVEEGRLLYLEVGDDIPADTNTLASGGIKLIIGAVICIGTVIVVGFAAFGMRRKVKALTHTTPDKDDVGFDDRPSVLITSNVGEPGIIRDV